MPLSTSKAKPKPYRKTVLYATHGFGKSTWAWGREQGNPVFIRTEDGIDDIEANIGTDDAPEVIGVQHAYPVCKSLADLEQQVAELMTEEHDRRRLVIDSADWLEPLVVERVLQKRPTGDNDRPATSLKDHGFGRGERYLAEEFEGILRLLSSLQAEKQMTVVFLAHCHTEQVKLPDSEPYDRYVPKLSRQVSALLQEWADEVFFGTEKKTILKDKGAFNQEHRRAVPTGERVVKTSSSPAWMAKNRLNLPAELPLQWSAYANYWEPAHED